MAVTSIVANPEPIFKGRQATFTVTHNVAAPSFSASDISVRSLSSGSPSNFTNVDSSTNLVFTFTLDIGSSEQFLIIAVTGGDARWLVSQATSGSLGGGQLVDPPPAPSPVITFRPVTDGVSGRTVTAVISWSIGVTGFTSDEVSVSVTDSDGGTHTAVKGAFSGMGNSYEQVITYPSNIDGTLTVSIAASVAEDSEGEVNTAGSGSIDFSRPTFGIMFDKESPFAGEVVTANISSSAAVQGFTASDVQVSTGSKGALTANPGGQSWSMPITLPTSQDGTLTVSIAANRVTHGNKAASESVSFKRPSATVDFVDDKAVSGRDTTANIVWDFSGISGFSSSDITVTGGSLRSLNGSGTNWTAVVRPSAFTDGTVTLTIRENQITQGNPSASDSVDYARPVPTVSLDKTETGNSEVVIATIEWDIAPQPNTFSSGDIDVSRGAKGSFSGSGTTFTQRITSPSSGSGTVTVSVRANSIPEGNVSDSESFTYTPIPVPNISFSTGTPISGRPFTVIIGFSRSVSGLVSGEVGITGGAKGTFTAVSGSRYELVVTPNNRTDGTVAVSIAANVVAEGNVAANRSIGYLRPRFTISFNVARLHLSGEAIATLQCSTTTSDFVEGDVNVAVGTKGAFTVVDADTYTLAFTSPAAGSGIITISIPANVVPEGNPAVSRTITYADVIRPTITFDVETAIRSTTFYATIRFSAPVTRVFASTFSVTGATRGSLSTQNDQTYVLAITPPSSGSGVIRVSIGSDAVPEGNIAATETINYAGSTSAPVIEVSSPQNLMVNTSFDVAVAKVRNVPDIVTAEGLLERTYYTQSTKTDGAPFVEIRIRGNIPDLKSDQMWDLFAQNVHGDDDAIVIYNVVEPAPIIGSVSRPTLRKGRSFSITIPVTNRIGSSEVRGLLVNMRWEQLESGIRIYGDVPNVNFTTSTGEFRIEVGNSAGEDSYTLPFDIAA